VTRPALAVVVGSVGGAAGALGAGALVDHLIVASESPDAGATAATLDEALGTFALGVVPMLFIAALAAGFAARSPFVAVAVAIGAAVLLAAVAALISWADWPTAVFLVIVAAMLGTVAAAVVALPIVFRGGPR
jgi:ABC-type phosphate/phosphonate transport system permease subunit